MKSFDSRIELLEATQARRKYHGLTTERRKFLTDRAVLHDDQEALAELNCHRPEKIVGSKEQREAAIAAALRCMEDVE
jgi:uncharacterized glyoxalase superfamily metalloenzyme YdcJ